MAENVPNDSVHDEQFGDTENTEKNAKGESLKEEKNTSQQSTDPKQDIKKVTTDADSENPDSGREAKMLSEDEGKKEGESKNEKEVKTPESSSVEMEKKTENSEDKVDPVKSEKEKKEDLNKSKDESSAKEEIPESENKESEDDKHSAGKKEVLKEEKITSETKQDSEENKVQVPQREKIDYSKLSKEDLVKVFKDLLDQHQTEDIRKDVETIKSNFYKKQKADTEAIRKKFLAEGGQIQDFKLEENPLETTLKELLGRYREIRAEFNKKLDEEKVANLAEKYKIIDSIKDLVNSQESLNKTFHDFRELQNRWREIGPVPQQNLKDLWESYHYQVEAFYDYIKINKELRDLDLKKNLEAKIKLCEKAEELLIEPSVVEAFRRLQKLHDQWREIGPVPIEKRTEIWERFKESTTKINRKHQEYFVNLKQEQKKNYEEKLVLCEKAEEISVAVLDNHKEWEEKSKQLIELQKVWKTIGFAPKKYNTQIYERFRKACDAFFDRKREYYSHNREEQQNNLQLKTELCIQAEGLKDSTDWKKTTDELISLQKKWKEIGPVPLKQSDKIWKRFRAACDVFFENKSKFYSQADTRYEENLEKKIQLIEEIKNLKLSGDVEKNLTKLKDFQSRWSEIGYVPIKNKNEIQEQYREAINKKFDELKLDDNKKSLLKFRSRIENIVTKPNSQTRLRNERDKCFNKMKQLENDITLWENNIGFFADSENAESMITDVNRKIESAKSKIELLKGKIKILDEFDS